MAVFEPEVGQDLTMLVPYGGRDIACQAKVLTMAGMLVEVSSPTRHAVKIPTLSDHVVLQVYRADALYQARCEVLETAASGMRLAMPQESEFERVQRRRFVRWPVDLACHLIPIGANAERLGLPIKARMENLGAGGCAQRCERPLSEGSRVWLRCALLDARFPRLYGTIRRCRPDEGSYAMGLEFDNLSAAQLTEMTKLINELQRRPRLAQ